MPVLARKTRSSFMISSGRRPAAARLAWIVGVAVAVTVGSAPALAAHVSPVDEPHVFEGADVNTAVLQFTWAGSRSGEMSDRARQLSQLIQLDTLFSQLGYHSIGIGHLLIEPGSEHEADPDLVIARMTSPDNPGGTVRKGGGLILLRGRVFEHGDEIFVQTDIRFFRLGKDERIDLPIKDQEFAGSLPVQTISFPPRRLTERDLGEILDGFRRNAFVREERDHESTKTAIPLDRFDKFAYVVRKEQGGWLWIDGINSDVEGWIYAPLDREPGKLRQRMPELDFLEGTAGYLRARAALEREEFDVAEQVLPQAERAFARFETAADPRREGVALAASKSMGGMLTILTEGPDAGIRSGAGDRFAEAAALMPYSADARNLQAIAGLYRGVVLGDRSVPLDDTLKQLQRALSIEPGNDETLGNLESFYSLLARDEENALSFSLEREDLDLRLQSVREVRTHLARPD